MKKLKHDSMFLANFENKMRLAKDIIYIINFLSSAMCTNKNFNKLVKHLNNSNKILYNLYKIIMYLNTGNTCIHTECYEITRHF